jgi:hypothetical protein
LFAYRIKSINDPSPPSLNGSTYSTHVRPDIAFAFSNLSVKRNALLHVTHHLKSRQSWGIRQSYRSSSNTCKIARIYVDAAFTESRMDPESYNTRNASTWKNRKQQHNLDNQHSDVLLPFYESFHRLSTSFLIFKIFFEHILTISLHLLHDFSFIFDSIIAINSK